ncbi:MAG: agmatinase family protein [Reichenbachiella sp.]|uniref:agmatinase family protein n=1 Tax=Reichenbachiella sp. TaxID=2184521 RepID=UPI003265A94E
MEPDSEYNPSAVGIQGSIFGLPFKEEEADIIIIPVPWDVTVSYNEGTADGPDAILNASPQLDLEIPDSEAPWKQGIWMAPIDQNIREKSRTLRAKVNSYIQELESRYSNPDLSQVLVSINEATESLKEEVKATTLSHLSAGKKTGLVGGDHSCPLGYIEALAETYGSFGILQIDAHMDLRNTYEGFTHSHASIMYNALQLSEVTQLIQVGIRDYCEEEVDVTQSDDRISTFYDLRLKDRIYSGESWKSICSDIISGLPDKVYVSFDIDGLRPSFCPGTGTPVPGGLDYDEALFLIRQVRSSGRQIIGFDLCEVAPQDHDKEWNANVGARILYALCGLL